MIEFMKAIIHPVSISMLTVIFQKAMQTYAAQVIIKV